MAEQLLPTFSLTLYYKAVKHFIEQLHLRARVFPIVFPCRGHAKRRFNSKVRF